MSNENKTYDELGFTDDFLFCHILANNEDLCIELTELITGRKVSRIVKMHTQKAIQITEDGRGIRFDVYFEDDADHVFDIEMQTTNTGNLKYRIRYYQSMIDMDYIDKGGNYKNLKDTCIIFICTFDLFGKGLHKYTFRDTCVEDPTLYLENGTEKIFLCAGGMTDDCSPAMREFLDYISTNKATGAFTQRLASEVNTAHQKNEWRSSYMMWLDMKKELLEEGREEGIERGREQAYYELVHDGDISEETAASKLAITIDAFKEAYASWLKGRASVV